MAVLNEKELILKLRQHDLASLYFLYGPDEYSKSICCEKLLRTFSPDAQPRLFDGQALNLSELHEECNCVSFFSENKCVFLRNPQLESFSPSQADSFFEILSTKPDSCCLVIVVKGHEVKPKLNAKWAKLIKTVSAGGIVVECIEKTQSDAVSMIISTAKKNGCAIDSELAASLAQRSLNDMQMLDNELCKLCAYAQKKENGVITQDAVYHLTSLQLDYKVFEITRHIIAHRAQTALHILDSLFLQQVDAVAINSALSSVFLDLYRVKIMQEYGHTTNELCSAFSYRQNDFKLRGASYDAPKCTLMFLKNAILTLSRSDIMLKSTKDDKKTVMEIALFNILKG